MVQTPAHPEMHRAIGSKVTEAPASTIMTSFQGSPSRLALSLVTLVLVSACTTTTPTPAPLAHRASTIDDAAAESVASTTMRLVVDAGHDASVPRASCTCPSSVLGATSTANDVAGGIDLIVVGVSAEATKEIQRRGESIEQVARHFAMVMEPRGWMADDRFSDSYDDVEFGDGAPRSGSCGPPRPCPILARAASVKVTTIEGGVRIAMRADARDLARLRAQVRKRLATFAPTSFP